MQQLAQCTSQRLSCWVLALLLLGVSVQTVRAANICLNMIAKNEAKEILTALEPLAAELAGWTLCDTGSTDDTVQIVEDFFSKQATRGTVAHHSWQDFGHNRNLCIEAGLEWSQQQAKEQGLQQQHFCDYLLFLDADQILHRLPHMKPGDLKAMDLQEDGYYMTERGVGVTYQNMRLVSTRVEWEWVGEVHEFIQRKDGQRKPDNSIEGLWFAHDATGGQGGQRFERDEVILSKAVKERPTDPRARFYLANTLRALRRDEEAITHYVERIRLGNWAEEVFMSALNIAELARRQWEQGKIISPQIQAAVGNWGSHFAKTELSAVHQELEEEAYQAATANLVAAFNATKNETDPAVQLAKKALESIRQKRKARQFPLMVAAYTAALVTLPYRPEPWVNLAKLYRQEKDDKTKCFNFAAGALAQGEPHSDALFLSTHLARFEIMDEMCTCGYYTDNGFEQGRAACKKLQERLVADLQQFPEKTFLQAILDRTNGNLGWYEKKAKEMDCPEGAPEGTCKGTKKRVAIE